jgi:hypothetical protein
MKAKYIIIEKGGMELPLVFSELLLHAEMAGKYRLSAAGYCELAKDGRWHVGGQSSSLKLNSRPEDAAILAAHL